MTFNDSFYDSSESTKTDNSAEIMSLFDQPTAPYQPQPSPWRPQMSSNWGKSYSGVFQNPYNTTVNNNMHHSRYNISPNYPILTRQPSIVVQQAVSAQQHAFSRQSSLSWNGSASSNLSAIPPVSSSLNIASASSPMMFQSPSLQTNTNMFFGNNFTTTPSLTRNNSFPTYHSTLVTVSNNTPASVNGNVSPAAIPSTPSLLDEPLPDLMAKKKITSTYFHMFICKYPFSR